MLVLEGVERATAARIAGWIAKALHDWVHRCNAEGLAGLACRCGRTARSNSRRIRWPSLPTGCRLAPTRCGMTWRAGGARILAVGSRSPSAQRGHGRAHGVQLAALRFRRLSVRPQHPKSDAAAQEAHKNFSAAVTAAIPEHARVKSLEIWFQIKQELARKARSPGSGSGAVADLPIYATPATNGGAVCLERGVAGGLVLPFAGTRPLLADRCVIACRAVDECPSHQDRPLPRPAFRVAPLHWRRARRR